MSNNGTMDVMFGGKGLSFAGADGFKDLKKEAAVEAHNKAVDTYTKALNKNIKDELEKAEEVTEKMNSMEIMPINSYVLVRPYAKNPYQKIEVTKGGLINPDTGEKDTEYQLSVVANVIEVSPLCKFIKPGDDIYYRRSSGVPVPFFRQGFEVVAEQQVQVVINEGLKERFKSIE